MIGQYHFGSHYEHGESLLDSGLQVRWQLHQVGVTVIPQQKTRQYPSLWIAITTIMGMDGIDLPDVTTHLPLQKDLRILTGEANQTKV